MDGAVLAKYSKKNYSTWELIIWQTGKNIINGNAFIHIACYVQFPPKIGVTALT